MEITHPFHPLHGQKFHLLKSRKWELKDHLYLKGTDLGSFAIPRDWTSLKDPDQWDDDVHAPILAYRSVCEIYQLVKELKNSKQQKG